MEKVNVRISKVTGITGPRGGHYFFVIVLGPNMYRSGIQAGGPDIIFNETCSVDRTPGSNQLFIEVWQTVHSEKTRFVGQSDVQLEQIKGSGLDNWNICLYGETGSLKVGQIKTSVSFNEQKFQSSDKDIFNKRLSTNDLGHGGPMRSHDDTYNGNNNISSNSQSRGQAAFLTSMAGDLITNAIQSASSKNNKQGQGQGNQFAGGKQQAGNYNKQGGGNNIPIEQIIGLVGGLVTTAAASYNQKNKQKPQQSQANQNYSGMGGNSYQNGPNGAYGASSQQPNGKQDIISQILGALNQTSGSQNGGKPQSTGGHLIGILSGVVAGLGKNNKNDAQSQMPAQSGYYNHGDQGQGFQPGQQHGGYQGNQNVPSGFSHGGSYNGSGSIAQGKPPQGYPQFGNQQSNTQYGNNQQGNFKQESTQQGHFQHGNNQNGSNYQASSQQGKPPSGYPTNNY